MGALVICVTSVVLGLQWLVQGTHRCGPLDCLDHPSNTETMNARPTHNEGDFGSLFFTNKEEMKDVPVVFKKPLPTWLNGTLVRNGMGQFENGPRKFLHAFDGFAKMASWKFFGNGTVLFSTRFLGSNFYNDSMASGTIAPYLLFQTVSPSFGFFEKMKCLLNGLDNMNINVFEMRHPQTQKREHVALSDYWDLYSIDIGDLSTLGKITPDLKSVSFSQRPGSLHLMSTAHPVPEPGTNNVLMYLLGIGVMPWESSTLSLIRSESWKSREVIATWKINQLPYMHSFSVTQTKAILLESPFYISMACMAINVTPFYCIDWYPEKSSILHVIDLASGTVTSITTSAIFSMHHVNAYDVGSDQIVMDVSTYPSPDFVKHLELSILRDPERRNNFEARARLKRITINLTDNNVNVTNIGQDPNPGLASYLDMPVINENRRSRHYCFVYGLVVKADNVTLCNVAVVKKDVCHNGRDDAVWIEEHTVPAEPWFVPNPKAVREDDGILLVEVFRGKENKTHLLVLDAMTMTVIDDAESPTIIPYALHGRFFNASVF